MVVLAAIILQEVHEWMNENEVLPIFRPSFGVGHCTRVFSPSFVLFFYELLNEVPYDRGTVKVLNLHSTTPIGVKGRYPRTICKKYTHHIFWYLIANVSTSILEGDDEKWDFDEWLHSFVSKNFQWNSFVVKTNLVYSNNTCHRSVDLSHSNVILWWGGRDFAKARKEKGNMKAVEQLIWWRFRNQGVNAKQEGQCTSQTSWPATTDNAEFKSQIARLQGHMNDVDQWKRCTNTLDPWRIGWSSVQIRRCKR